MCLDVLYAGICHHGEALERTQFFSRTDCCSEKVAQIRCLPGEGGQSNNSCSNTTRNGALPRNRTTYGTPIVATGERNLPPCLNKKQTFFF